MTHAANIINDDLRNLRLAFQDRDVDLRLVGGCVRDLLLGEDPKDIDLCTDADPTEQVTIYQEIDAHYILTGLQHGTVTVVMDDRPYEITSLRTEANHDGRWAEMIYTRDWDIDLGRRDLTINAMALTFDGQLIDPFGGQDDLEKRRIRFVGRARDRMREDALRILRWLRFHGRFAPDQDMDDEAMVAARIEKRILDQISRERVWSEVIRILPSPGGPRMIQVMDSLALHPHIGMPRGSIWNLADAHQATRNPIALMVAYLGGDTNKIAALSTHWRWSRKQTQEAQFLAAYLADTTIDPRRMIAVDGHQPGWVDSLLRLQGRVAIADELGGWEVPSFPVSGNDVMSAGVGQGKTVGHVLKRLKELWAERGYTASHQDLMQALLKRR